MITLATYPNYLEAHIAANYLKANGIECFVADENFSRIYSGVIGSIASTRIMVAEKDFESATALLQEMHKR